MERLGICVLGSNFKKLLKKDLGKRKAVLSRECLNLGC